MRVEAPRVAASALPGQFVIVRADEQGERVPLTVADYDRTAGTVTIVTQTIGVSTRKICALEAGDALADFALSFRRRRRRHGAGLSAGQVVARTRRRGRCHRGR